MKKLFLLLSAVFALSTTTFAQRIAVVDFNAGVGISQQDVDGIAAIFNTYFSPSGYTLVERTTIDRVIDEQQFQRGKITEQQMVRLGQILNVSKIVIGDVNVVAGEYNIDVRVVNVESGTIAAKDGATWSQGNTYRELMKGLATRLANQIAINPRASQSVSTETSATRNKVEVIFGYLKVFPNELGEFPSEPKTVIEQINKQAMHDYNTWRLPTTEELALLKANGLVGSGKYMTSSTSSNSGIVLLVTDAEETYSIKCGGNGNNGVYKVGYIYKKNGKVGVVFEVSGDGKHGRIISIQETKCRWDEANTWCAQLGNGWRLPTRQELLMIYKLKENTQFNEGLFWAESPEMKRGSYYWTGEEYNSYNAWNVRMYRGSTSSGYKSSSNYVRAVSAF